MWDQLYWSSPLQLSVCGTFQLPFQLPFVFCSHILYSCILQKSAGRLKDEKENTGKSISVTRLVKHGTQMSTCCTVNLCILKLVCYSTKYRKLILHFSHVQIKLDIICKSMRSFLRTKGCLAEKFSSFQCFRTNSVERWW